MPKLLGPHADEIAMLRDAGIGAASVRPALVVLGAAEILLAFGLVIFSRRRLPLRLCLGSMLMATVAVAISSPRYFGAAFNPVTLNLAVVCLAVIDLIVLDGVPSAARRRRRPPAEAT